MNWIWLGGSDSRKKFNYRIGFLFQIIRLRRTYINQLLFSQVSLGFDIWFKKIWLPHYTPKIKVSFFLVKIHIIWWISVYNPCIYAFWNKMGQYRNSVHILLCTGLLKCWVDFIHIHCKELNATKMSMMWKKGVSVVFVALRIFRLQKIIIAMNEKYAYSSFKARRMKWKWFRFFDNSYCPKVLW